MVPGHRSLTGDPPNHTLSVKAPHGGQRPKVVPSRTQVLAMINQAPDPRMRAFDSVLAYSGLRSSEALGLRWEDWDDAGTMRAMTAKGGRSRAIPVPEKSTRITEAVYSHVTAPLAEESARALDRAL